MCHFYIYLNIYDARVNANGLKFWADYMFSILKDAPKKNQFPVSKEDIVRMMVSSGHADIVLGEDDKIYEKGDKSKCFHH